MGSYKGSFKGPLKGSIGDSIRVRGLELGGSWVVMSGVIIMVSILITHIRGLLTLLIPSHEPPSRLPAWEFTG